MRLTQICPFFFSVFLAHTLIAQQEGLFVAPSALVGYDYISVIYQPIQDVAPANKGYNVAVQFGGVAGYKLKYIGFQVEFKSSNFQQHMQQQDLEADFSVRYNTFGGHFLYLLGEINQSDYYHTVKLGALYNQPKYAHYLAKNTLSGEVYANDNQLNLLQNNMMISVEYGITRGYKLLWADFSIRAAYNLNNIYKPLTDVNGKNFFIGFQLGFGLFANTNK